MVSAEGIWRRSPHLFCLCVAVLASAHPNFLLKWSSHCLLLAASGLPGLSAEILSMFTRLIRPTVVTHLCVYHPFSVFLLTSFGPHLFLTTQNLAWTPTPWCLLICPQSPGDSLGDLWQVSGTSLLDAPQGCSASTKERSNIHCLLCLVPASLNPLFNLILNTKPGGWYSIIITYVGGRGAKDLEMLNNVTEFREAVGGRAGIQYLTPESGHCPSTTLLPELMHTWWASGGLHSIGQLLSTLPSS